MVRGERDFRRMVERLGGKVVSMCSKGKHPKYTIARKDGSTFIHIPCRTPSDHRSMRNSEAQIRKALDDSVSDERC